VAQGTTGAAQGTLAHIEYQLAQHVNAPPTNNICVGNIDLLGNSAVEDIDEQSEVTVSSEAVVGQNAEQLVGTQEGPQVPAQFNAQWNVGLCNRDSNFQVGYLDQAVVAQGAKGANNQSAADILDQQSKLGAVSANSQINMVGMKHVVNVGNLEAMKLGGEQNVQEHLIVRIQGELKGELSKINGELVRLSAQTRELETRMVLSASELEQARALIGEHEDLENSGGLSVISYLCADKDGAVLDQNHVPNEQQEADVARQLGDFASTSNFGSDLTLEVRSVSGDPLALQRFENVLLDERREALTAFGYVRIASVRFAARADVVEVVEDDADVVAVAHQNFYLVWVVRYSSSWTGVSSLLEYDKRIAWYEALHD
jgi:hypothetical protein